MKEKSRTYVLTWEHEEMGADLGVEGVGNVINWLLLGKNILDGMSLQVQTILSLLTKITQESSSGWTALNANTGGS